MRRMINFSALAIDALPFKMAAACISKMQIIKLKINKNKKKQQKKLKKLKKLENKEYNNIYLYFAKEIHTQSRLQPRSAMTNNSKMRCCCCCCYCCALYQSQIKHKEWERVREREGAKESYKCAFLVFAAHKKVNNFICQRRESVRVRVLCEYIEVLWIYPNTHTHT